MKTPAHWQRQDGISTLLTPLSWLYGAAATCDRVFTQAEYAPLPVISVGNVTAGGAGKTPTTLALIPLLRALGHTPHILTRGYGGAPLVAHPARETDDWKLLGDEALLLARAAPTWVGRNRLASARAAAQAGASILVCDDALQHHALHKNFSLLVIDGAYGIGNGKLLPAGPLREPLRAAAARCDAALIIGEDAQHLAQQFSLPVLHATLVPTNDTAFLREGKWLAFAGIGRPEKFYASLRALGATLVETKDFPDHYAYEDRDIASLIARAQSCGATLITTEKDLVKTSPALRPSIACLPIAARIENPDSLQNLIANKLSASASRA